MEMQARMAASDFISATCQLLDEEKFKDFLAVCAPDFEYRVTAQSPELGTRMTWLEHDRAGFESMLGMLPQHVRSDAVFSRHATVSRMVQREPARVEVRSKLAVFQTDLKGTSAVLAVGTYIDVLDMTTPEAPVLRSRELQLDTRDLGVGIHVPL